MKLLFVVANAFSAAYRIILYSWLISVLIHQFKHRKEVLQRTPTINEPPKRLH